MVHHKTQSYRKVFVNKMQDQSVLTTHVFCNKIEIIFVIVCSFCVQSELRVWRRQSSFIFHFSEGLHLSHFELFSEEEAILVMMPSSLRSKIQRIWHLYIHDMIENKNSS